jgi:hypothetical protein
MEIIVEDRHNNPALVVLLRVWLRVEFTLCHQGALKKLQPGLDIPGVLDRGWVLIDFCFSIVAYKEMRNNC